jgi:hypothetical protein
MRPQRPIITECLKARVWHSAAASTTIPGRTQRDRATTNGRFAPGLAARLDGRMGTKSRESIYAASIRAAAEQAAEARKTADRLACEAWNKRMLGSQGPAQPSPALGDAINAGYLISKSNALAATPIKQSR